jgi:hypothetical protein
MPFKNNQMKALRATLCGKAEKVASLFDLKLDYTDESVKHVERILGEIHNDYLKTRDENGLFGIALEFGAYLVSIIERHHGTVDWKRDHESLGKESFPLYWNGTTLFPVGWCWKRIVDGPGDDVVAKWKVFVLKAPNKNDPAS